MELHCRLFVAFFLLTVTSAFDYRRVAQDSDEHDSQEDENDYRPYNSVKSGRILKPAIAKVRPDSSFVSHVEHPLPPAGIPSRVVLAKMATIKSSHDKKIEDTISSVTESLEKHSVETTERSAKDDETANVFLPGSPYDDNFDKKIDLKPDIVEKLEDKNVPVDHVEEENDVKDHVTPKLEKDDFVEIEKELSIKKDLAVEKDEMLEKKGDEVDAKLKEETISKIEEKEEVQHDLKDAVVEAFHHNFIGDRKEYFKRAVKKMSKEMLADLHEVLLHILAEPDSVEHDEEVKVEDVKEDLKKAVHELEEEVDDGKKEALIEIEHALDEEMKPKEETVENRKDDGEEYHKANIVGGVVTKDLHAVLNAKEEDKREEVAEDVEIISQHDHLSKDDHSKEELKKAEVEEVATKEVVDDDKEELKQDDQIPKGDKYKLDQEEKSTQDVSVHQEKIADIKEEPVPLKKSENIKENIGNTEEEDCQERKDLKDIDEKVIEDSATQFKQDDETKGKGSGSDVPVADVSGDKVGDVKVIKDSDDAYHDKPSETEHKEVVVKEESKEIDDIPKSQYHGSLQKEKIDEDIQKKDGEIKEVPPQKEIEKKEDAKEEPPATTPLPEPKKDDLKEVAPDADKKDASIDKIPKDVEIFHDLRGDPKESITEKIEPMKASREVSSAEEKNPKPVDEEPNKSYESLEDKTIPGFRNKMGRRHKDWGIDKEIGGRRCRRHHNSQHYYRSTRLALRRKRAVSGVGDNEIEDFPPPSRLRLPMRTAFRQINSAAPPDPYPRSKSSLSLPFLSIFEPATDVIMRDIKEGLQYVLQTNNEWTLALHGTGTTGMHAAIDNLLEPGDKIVVLINGYWGGLMANMSERIGAQVVRIHRAPGTRFTLDEIETALKIHRPQALGLVMGESSTTVMQPFEGIGELCRMNNVLLIADVVAVAGIQPVYMDKYKIDAVFASGHKGLGAAAGMAAVSFSPRAVEKMLTRATPARAYQTDIIVQAGQWNTTNPNRARTQSMSLPLMYAMREALATMVAEKIQNTYRRHEETTEQLKRGLVSLGLQFYVPEPSDRMVGITAVYPPPGKDARRIAAHMFNNYNIEISPGFGPTAGQILRMATFATNADRNRINNLLGALKNAIISPDTNI